MMPPKKKGSSKKPAKARTPTLIDGLTKEEMSKEQLEEHIVRLREELDREREERNYFQLERDKIHTFWEITDRQLEEAKAERKNLDKEIEQDEGRHQLEIKVYKQKMKHLLCEHQNTISELKEDGLVSTEVLQKEQEKLENELCKEMRAVMVDMQELDNENLLKELELAHDEEMAKSRNNWEKKLTEIKAKYQKNLELMPQELDDIRKQQTTGGEDHWNSHITALTDGHNKACSEITALFSAVEQDVDVNTLFKKQIADLQTEQKVKDKNLQLLLQDNRCLVEPLSKAKQQNAETERKMKYFRPQKDAIEKIKKNELDDLKCNYEALEQKFSKVKAKTELHSDMLLNCCTLDVSQMLCVLVGIYVNVFACVFFFFFFFVRAYVTQLQMERDELNKTFTQNIQKVQHKAGMRSVMLERKLKALTDSVEKTQAQLSSVLSASNIDRIALSGVINKIEENLDSSNNTIKNLQHKKAQISQARKDLLLTYEAKQRALGVPVEELCPFESIHAGKSLDLGLAPK